MVGDLNRSAAGSADFLTINKHIEQLGEVPHCCEFVVKLDLESAAEFGALLNDLGNRNLLARCLPSTKVQLMKEKTVKLIAAAAALTPAAAFAAAGAVQSGVEGTKCLRETLQPCPATDLLAVEPDMPIENGGPVPVRVPIALISSGTTVSIANAPLFFVQG
jgi:hypothetical protein